MHWDLFWDLLCSPNLRWVLGREYADYSLLRGLVFQAWGSLTSLKSQTRNPQLKVPPGGLVLRIFTSWKKYIDLSRVRTREPSITRRGEHVTPRPPRTTSNLKIEEVYFRLFCMLSELNRDSVKVIYRDNVQWRLRARTPHINTHSHTYYKTLESKLMPMEI